MPPVGNGTARGRPAGPGSPTKPSPKPPGLSSVLARNIATLKARREREEAEATLQARVADAITRFTGSMPFVYIHPARRRLTALQQSCHEFAKSQLIVYGFVRLRRASGRDAHDRCANKNDREDRSCRLD